jgi:hypothetical protein
MLRGLERIGGFRPPSSPRPLLPLFLEGRLRAGWTALAGFRLLCVDSVGACFLLRAIMYSVDVASSAAVEEW